MTLRIAGIVHDSIVDGPGMRMTIFAQGCPHHCVGCHNPHTHALEGGTLADTQALAGQAIANPLCAGVTLSGGEPFLQAEAMADIARRVQEGGKTVWTYTGYTYEQLLQGTKEHPAWDALLHSTDVLIDGPFVLAEHSMNLLFRGSRNQRLLKRDTQGVFVIMQEP